MTITKGGTSDVLHHEAFVYSSDSEYAATLAPLVGDALDSGCEVLAVVSPLNAGLLQDALGPRALETRWIDATAWYRKPVGTIAGYDAILRNLAPGTPAFVIGEVQFGADERSHLEWARYESLLNEVLAHYRARVICPYDTRVLPPAVVDHAARTHPRLVMDGTVRPSATYSPPETWLRERAVAARIPVRPADVELDADLTPLAARRALETVARRRGTSEVRITEMRLGISEVVTNAFVHGAAPVRLRLWSVPELVCAVEDGGHGVTDPLLGFRPPESHSTSGRGLWLARQAFDHVELDVSALGGLLVYLGSASA